MAVRPARTSALVLRPPSATTAPERLPARGIGPARRPGSWGWRRGRRRRVAERTGGIGRPAARDVIDGRRGEDALGEVPQVGTVLGPAGGELAFEPALRLVAPERRPEVLVGPPVLRGRRGIEADIHQPPLVGRA